MKGGDPRLPIALTCIVILVLASSGCSDDGIVPPDDGETRSVFQGAVDKEVDSWYDVSWPNGGQVEVDATTGNAQGSIGESAVTSFRLRWYNSEVGDEIAFTHELVQKSNSANWSYTFSSGTHGETFILTQEYINYQQGLMGFSEPIILQATYTFTLRDTATKVPYSADFLINWEVVNKPSMVGACSYTLWPIGSPTYPSVTRGNATFYVVDNTGTKINGALIEMEGEGEGFHIIKTDYTDSGGRHKFQSIPIEVTYAVTVVGVYIDTGWVEGIRDEARTASFEGSAPLPQGDSYWIAKFSTESTGVVAQVPIDPGPLTPDHILDLIANATANGGTL